MPLSPAARRGIQASLPGSLRTCGGGDEARGTAAAAEGRTCEVSRSSRCSCKAPEVLRWLLLLAVFAVLLAMAYWAGEEPSGGETLRRRWTPPAEQRRLRAGSRGASYSGEAATAAVAVTSGSNSSSGAARAPGGWQSGSLGASSARSGPGGSMRGGGESGGGHETGGAPKISGGGRDGSGGGAGNRGGTGSPSSGAAASGVRGEGSGAAVRGGGEGGGGGVTGKGVPTRGGHLTAGGGGSNGGRLPAAEATTLHAAARLEKDPVAAAIAAAMAALPSPPALLQREPPPPLGAAAGATTSSTAPSPAAASLDSTAATASLSLRYVIPSAQEAMARLSGAAAAPGTTRPSEQPGAVAAMPRVPRIRVVPARGVIPGINRALSLPQRPPAETRRSRWCSAATPGQDMGPKYHLVVLASPRPQQGRYLASTLVSIAAAEARPTSLTVLWAAHREDPGGSTAAAGSNKQAPGRARRLSADDSSSSSRNSSSRSDEDAGGTGGSAGSGGGGAVATGVEVKLVQRLEMPPPKAPPRAAAEATAAAESSGKAVNQNGAFSLLAQLEMYDRSSGGGSGGGGGDVASTQGPAAVGGGFGSLRVRYLPKHVKEGDIMSSYYQALLVPDQVADEAGDPRLRELPLVVLEGDVLLAPRFADRLGCVLEMMRDLGSRGQSGVTSGSSGGGSSSAVPDFALSLYDPGMVPHDVQEAMRLYQAAPVPPDELPLGAPGNQRAGKGRDAAPPRRRKAQTPSNSSQGLSGEEDGAGVGWRRRTHGSQERVPTGALRKGPGSDAGEAIITQLTLVPALWSWGSQGLLYSYRLRLSLMRHYRELLSGCVPQDGLQDIELVRHMENRHCFGLPYMRPVVAKPRVQGPSCDPRVIHGNDTAAGAPVPGTPCYLFAVRPNLVQHVGASSSLFGEVSQRFHLSTSFPRRVTIPGLDPPGTW